MKILGSIEKVLYVKVVFIACSFLLLTQTGCKNISASNKNTNDSKNDSSLMIYPGVDGLEKVKGFEESKIFDLKINDKDAFVYRSFEILDEHEHVKQLRSISYQGVSYVNFSMEKEVNLEVTTNDKVDKWTILPNNNIKTETTENSLKFSLSEPQKFVISAVIEDKEQFFIISAEVPETKIPSKDDKSVLFLEPGVHQYGQAWDPFVDGVKTLYVSGGAVLEATIKSKNKDGVKILGRGVLSQSFTTHAEESSKEQEWDSDWLGIVFIDSKDIEIDGIAVMSSPSYQLEFANSEDAIVNNVKLCGFGEHNNDGIHTYGRNILVQNSFVASNDDRICVTGLFDKENGTSDDINWDGSNELTGTPVSNIIIKDMVFWGLDNNGGDIMLTWNGSDYAKDVTIENVISLTSTNKAFIAARHGGSADIHDLKIKNIKLYHGNLFDVEIGGKMYQGAGGGKLRNISLENVYLDSDFAHLGKQLMGQNKESNIDNITFKNISTNEGVITSIDQLNIKANEFVTGLEVIN